ncbi:MAG TPA: hypothetical protein VN657_01525 [Nitrospiraceae bacterium]|nr:hypothetical protein [Nitrospiraceae bacterium]
MDFHLQAGEKFACVAFENLAIDDSLSKPVSLGEGLWTLPEHPFDLDNRWRDWIGKIRADQVGRCNFFLLAVKASTRPEVLDDENKRLRKRLDRLLYGLLLQGIPHHVDGFVLSGARVSEETMIRQFSELRDFYHSNPPHRVMFNEPICRTAKTFEEGYVAIEKSTAYERVKRGMSALVRAISEPTLEERIHQYARALEALVKPEISKSTSQFTHRCQTFALAGMEAKQILDECYKIRSAVEHMKLVDDALTGYSSDKRQLIASQRLRQIEGLAFSVYLKLATSQSHARLFETDTLIDEFWSKRDDECRSAWGNPLNITAIV